MCHLKNLAHAVILCDVLRVCRQHTNHHHKSGRKYFNCPGITTSLTQEAHTNDMTVHTPHDEAWATEASEHDTSGDYTV
jgi:hypothetical protein